MADERSLILQTGVAMGPVMIEFALLDAPPAAPDPGGAWEDAQQGVLDLDAPLLVTAPAFDTGVDEPVLVPPRPGRYGFRVLASGRSAHYDEVVDRPTETYEIVFWPA